MQKSHWYVGKIIKKISFFLDSFLENNLAIYDEKEYYLHSNGGGEMAYVHFQMVSLGRSWSTQDQKRVTDDNQENEERHRKRQCSQGQITANPIRPVCQKDAERVDEQCGSYETRHIPHRTLSIAVYAERGAVRNDVVHCASAGIELETH